MNAQALLDSVVTAYMQCALWSSTDDEGEPLDRLYEVWDLADEAQTAMAEDCQDFLDLIKDEVWNWDQFWTPERLGHDFWLTRNGHGAGFWDRYSGRQMGATIGRQLTELSKPYGESYLYVGDDGKLYVS